MAKLKCPKCQCTKFQMGPSAGLARNIRCENGHRWNATPFGMDAIGEDTDAPGCACEPRP